MFLEILSVPFLFFFLMLKILAPFILSAMFLFLFKSILMTLLEFVLCWDAFRGVGPCCVFITRAFQRFAI